jgi:hypothetical protein
MRYALNALFLNLYDHKRIYAPSISDTSNLNLVKKGDLETLLKCKTEEEIRRISVILCHIKYNFPDISDNFGEHTSLMIIREPTERIISHYEYFIRKKNNIPINDLSTDQLHKFCSREDVRDTMTDYLSHSKSETEAIEVANEINFLDDIQNINYLFERIKKFYERECGFLINTLTVPFMNKSEGENKQNTEIYHKIKEITYNSKDNVVYNYIIRNLI